MLRDVLYHLGFDSNKRNKEILHEFHKRVIGIDSMAGKTHETVSQFILSVTLFWAERGIFVRTSRKMPLGIEDMPLEELWNVL
jgi:hypothetical protein